jgi:hypothetical protein
MRIINTWGNKHKQSDKVQIKVRFGRVTLFDFYYDGSDAKWALTFINITIKP